MNTDDYDRLLGVLDKMATVQIRTLTRVTRMQAQLLVIESTLHTVLANLGGDQEETRRRCDALFAKYEDELLSELKAWLVEKEIAHPKGEDPWWDKPGAFQ